MRARPGSPAETVRNNYFQPAMRELMAHSVSVWESDPDAFSYHPVGFLQIAPAAMAQDVAQIYAEAAGHRLPSVLVEGRSDCQRYLLGLFEDWQAPGSTIVLHENEGRLREQHAARSAAWRRRRKPRECGSLPASG